MIVTRSNMDGGDGGLAEEAVVIVLNEQEAEQVAGGYPGVRADIERRVKKLLEFERRRAASKAAVEREAEVANIGDWHVWRQAWEAGAEWEALRRAEEERKGWAG